LNTTPQEKVFPAQHQPWDISPADRQTQIALAIGQPLAFGAHPNTVLAVEAVRYAEMKGIAALLLRFLRQKPCTVKIEPGATDVHCRHEVVMIRHFQFPRQAFRR
jgi:hypothetical protein